MPQSSNVSDFSLLQNSLILRLSDGMQIKRTSDISNGTSSISNFIHPSSPITILHVTYLSLSPGTNANTTKSLLTGSTILVNNVRMSAFTLEYTLNNETPIAITHRSDVFR